MSKIIITPLGTVSPYTKNNMNCPGFLVEYKDNKILLDCGNGITRLLKFPDILNNLNVIVTHYHKDHFGDLGAIQYASYVYHNLGLIDDRIRIFLPKSDFGFNRFAITSNGESYSEYCDIVDSLSFYIDDLNISFKDNNSHTIESYMVKLQNSDFKIIYTSDVGTTNMTGLEEFCDGADLIICESSFLRKHGSNSKTHLTASDAATLACNSNAQKLLLTHFWPEEEKELYVEEAKEIFENVDAAVEGKKLILVK